MRSSRLPGIKTLDDFDFSFQPSIKREQIDSLHELGFSERKENVIFLGPPGVGKTHLAISLAIAAAQSGRRVYYGALADLITSLEEAKTTGQLGRRLKILTYPSLLVIDEIGYLPVSQTGAMLFFQLINRHYERASTVLTSNKGFEEWGQILGDEVMAAALIDRLLHHCHIVNIRGSSYRMRKHTDLSSRSSFPHSLLMVWIKKYEAGDLTREIHLQEEVVEYGAKIAALERKIGQLTMELDVMKKRALIRPSQQGARPSIISGPGASPSDGDVAS